jgi:hypothetical protein
MFMAEHVSMMSRLSACGQGKVDMLFDSGTVSGPAGWRGEGPEFVAGRGPYAFSTRL